MTTLAQLMQMAESRKHLTCTAKGCKRSRQGISPFCPTHNTRLHRYGHIDGKAIRKDEYKDERQEVEAFFVQHRGHPAISAACRFIHEWQQEAGRQEAKMGQNILVRLHHRCITPQDILVEIMAVWLYSSRNPVHLPDDRRLSYAIAWAMNRLAGHERTTTKTGRRSHRVPPQGELLETGERVRGALARLFLNMTFAINAKAEKAKADREALSQPFV